MNEQVTTASAATGGEQVASAGAVAPEETTAQTTDSRPVAETADESAQTTEPQPPPPLTGGAAVSPPDVLSDFCSQIDSLAAILKGFATRQAELTQALISRGESEGAPAGASAEVGEALGAVNEMAAKQDELARLFESRIHLDEVQAKAFEHLHDEMQGYKQGFIRQEMLPLLKDVIFCHDVVAKELERLREEEATNASEAAIKTVEHVGQMLLDILYKYDIEPYRSETEYFDPASQQCVGTETTGIEGDDKRIAKVGLTGFRSPDSIVRREQVTVYKYKATEG